MRMKRVLGLAMLAGFAAWAQAPQPIPKSGAPVPVPVVTVEQPDAQRTREQLSQLLERYPPALRSVLGLDPTLLSNQTYLAPYPALLSYLNAHPEIARAPEFYIGGNGDGPFGSVKDHDMRVLDMWNGVLGGLAVFTGFGMGIGLLVWVIRTVIDYRRWNRLAKVQTDAHTKLLDRFTANEDLLAYIQSPAGSKFLESSPITLDAGPRSVGAPLGPDSLVGAGGPGARGARHRPRSGQRARLRRRLAAASRFGHSGHRSGTGVRDFGDNLVHDLAPAGADRAARAAPSRMRTRFHYVS